MSITEILERLVEFPTTTNNRQANQQSLDYIQRFLEVRGMIVERFEANGFESLVATVRPTKHPKVLLGAHIDVVPAPEDFFHVREVDGKLYGRGVLDMKFAIASYLKLVDELQDSLQDYDFGIMITTDEEVGGANGANFLIEKGYQADVCILPDGGPDWQIQLFAKGILWVSLAAFGKAAHSSQPWAGENAIIKLIDALNEVRGLFTAPQPEANTINIGKIAGGKATNQVADFAEVLLDVRVISEAEKTRLMQEISDIAKRRGIEFSVLVNGAVADFRLDNPYIAPFAQLITETTGVEVVGSRTLGTNDARFFAAIGVPCISLYPTGGGHHGANEWIATEALHQFHVVLQKYIQQVAQKNSLDSHIDK